MAMRERRRGRVVSGEETILRIWVWGERGEEEENEDEGEEGEEEGKEKEAA